MPKKALARRITWKDARSYRRLSPNPLGVTAIAAVNGRGSYKARYARARRLLGRPAAEGSVYRFTRPLPGYRRNRKATSKEVQSAAAKAKAAIESMKRKSGKAKGRKPKGHGRKPKGPSLSMAKLRKLSPAQKKAFAESRRQIAASLPRRKAKKGGRKVKGPSLSMAKLRKLSPAQKKAFAESRRQIAASLPRRKPKKSKGKKRTKLTARQIGMRKARAASRTKKYMARSPRMYGGGHFSAPRVRFGKYHAKQAYVYETARGGMRHLPEYSLLGFKSKRELNKALKDPARSERIAARRERIQKRRDRAADSVRKRGSVLVPNRRSRRTRTLSLSEWQHMYAPNPRRKKAKSGGRRRKATRRPRKHTKRVTRKTTRRRRRKAAPKVTVRRRRHRKAAPKATVRRRSHRGRKATVRRRHRKAAPKATVRRKRRKSRGRRVVATRRFRKGGYKIVRKFRGKPRRIKRVTVRLTSNRRRRHYSDNRRRGRRVPRVLFMRNVTMSGTFTGQLLDALKVGGSVLLGFATHRVLKNILKNNVGIGWFNQNAEWGNLAAGALIAAIGVPATVKFLPRSSKLVGAGMMMSLAFDAIVTLINKFLPDQSQKVLPYLSGYGDRAGYATSLGSYYEYQPRGILSGMGEYYVPGCGAKGNYLQAAAGFGAITEAAAGFGRLQQAAAGVGEYIATDLEGVGDYVEVQPEYTRAIPTEDGIRPNLSEAEKALNVAEGAAGVAGADQAVAAQFTVEPIDCSTGVGTEPEGERSGVLSGRDGIFGPVAI